MKRRAFSAMEALLVIGLVAVTAGVSVPMYRNYQIQNDLDIAVEQTLQGLRRAQLLSQSGELDNTWGFHVPSGTLYLGESYVVRADERDEVYPIPPTIHVTGLTEVVFARVSGLPNEFGEIQLEGLNGKRRIIVVSEDGVLGVSGTLPALEGGEDAGDDSGETAGATEGGTAGDTGDTGSTEGDTGSTTSGDTGSDTSGDTGSDTSGDTGSTDGGSTGGSGGETEACEDRFTVTADGTIETTGTVDATFEVLGSDITYGAGGPEVQVKTTVSLDGGDSWTDLFNGAEVDGGERQTIENLPTGTQIAVSVNGRYSWLFNQTYKSNDDSNHILVLRDGDALPSYQVFGNQATLEQFMRDVIGTDGLIDIGTYDVVLLTELGGLNQASSDFQDAVILIRFGSKAGSCAQSGDAKFKVHFDRLENAGQGDSTRRVYVGPYAIPYTEDQWIPLEVAGTTVVDQSLSEYVNGLTVQREDGQFRVRAIGKLPSSQHKEIVDATITLSGVHATSVQNESGQDAAENVFDGIVNDGSDGDEAGVADGSGSVLFQTRVTTDDDGIIIHWAQGTGGSTGGTGGDTGTDTGGTDSGDTAGEDGGDTAGDDSGDTAGDDGQDGGGDLDDPTPDACAATYTLDEENKIVLSEKADVTFQVEGSHATYGTRGPEVQVRLSVSFDGGGSWNSLYDYRDVDGGESKTFRDVPSGSRIVLRAEGRYSWLFKSVAQSTDVGGRIKLIKRGGPVPGTAPYANPSNLKGFVRELIQGSRVAIGKRSVLALIELQDLNAQSDYQDAAVQIILEKPTSSGVCSAIGDDSSSSSAGGSASSGGTSSAGSSSSSSSSSSSDEVQITVCHYPSGDTTKAQTLTIGASAWKAHQAHGDREGACDSDADGDTVKNSDDLCPGTYMPESVPKEYMLFDRFALTQDTPIFREGPRKKISKFNIEHSKGCSCEQIIDVAENVRPYYFDQFPVLQRNVRSLFPFYTLGARNYGCGEAILKMVQDSQKK